MNILYPLTFAFKSFNAVGNAYLAGQIGWWVFKEVRTMQKEKLNADKLKQKFIKDYKRQFGLDPTDEMVSVALEAYNAVERPVQHRVNTAKSKIVETTNYAKDRVLKKVKVTQEMVSEGVKEAIESWKKTRKDDAPPE